MPEIIERLTGDIPNAEAGFRLTLSSGPFPGHQAALTLVREDGGGNWYRLEGTEMEGWLCPALFHYYTSAPAKLFVQAEARASEAADPLHTLAELAGALADIRHPDSDEQGLYAYNGTIERQLMDRVEAVLQGSPVGDQGALDGTARGH